jgi:NAD+ synthase
MRAYADDQGKKGFVIGVSGGVDSALASTLAARTTLPTLCLSMPILQDPAELDRAREHCTWLAAQQRQVEVVELPLDRMFQQARDQWGLHHGEEKETELALVNTKSRLRLAALYYFATVRDALVIGTGNKVEQRGVGFFAKYGDGGMDIAPLGELSKSQVYALAYAEGIAQEILKAPPTDGLWPDGRTDFDQIGATYPELEWAMDLRESEAKVEEAQLTARQRTVLNIYDERHSDSRHKIGEAPRCPLPEGDNWPVEGGS